MAKGCYIYCIIESKKDESFGAIGIDGTEVHTIGYKELSAVISNGIESNSIDVLKNGIVHQKVIEKVMESHCVIPLSFGQIPKSAEEVKGFLAERYDELKELAKKVDGKVELGLKASWKREKIIKEIAGSNDRIRILQKQILPLPEQKSYYLKIELGKLVEDELKARGKALAGEIFNSLKLLAVDAKMNNPLNDKMILNASFLVSRDKESNFDKTVNEIEERHQQLALKYIVSPAHNFISLGVQHAVNR